MTTVNLAGTTIEAQRIFCIGRNYAAHAAELGNAVGSEPVVFMKPLTALVEPGASIRLPRGRGAVHHEAEVVLLIGRDDASQAQDVAGIALGLDLTLREQQNALKEKRLPWELAKAFDGSAPLGVFVPAPSRFDNVRFTCRVNGELRQTGDTANLLFPVPVLLEFLSRHFRLLRGDLIFTGTPEGVGPLSPGDTVELESTLTGRTAWTCA